MKIKLFRNLFSEVVVGSGATASTNPYYQLYGEVQVETVPGSDVFVKTLGLALDPTAGMTAEFVINSGLRGHFIAPHFNPYALTTIEKTTHNILKAKFFKGVVYGDPPKIQGNPVEVENYLVLKGGASNDIGFPAAWDHITTRKKFLSWHPVVKSVSVFQPELIHFLVQDTGVSSVHLKVKLTYTDDSELTITAASLPGVAQYDLLRIPAGVSNLNLASVEFTKSISHYELWIEDQNEAKISESRFYELDHIPQPWERFWLYENSLGMPEVFRTTGKTKYNTAVSSRYAQKALLANHSTKESQYLTRETYLRTDQQISTGLLRDRETAAYMLDFLSQKAPLFELRDGDYTPAQLMSPAIHEEAEDENYNYYVRFTVAGGFENTVFTPKLS